MGLVGNLVGIGFFGLVVLIALFYIPDLFGGLFDATGELYQATQLQIEPDRDNIICDLRVRTNVDIVQGFGLFGIGDKPHFEIDRFDSHEYTYYNCFLPAQFVLANLLDAGVGQAPRGLDALAQATPNTFVVIGDTFVEQCISLVDFTDPTQRVDSVLQPNMCFTTTLPSGFVDTPYTIDATFVVSNIPVRQYFLDISLNGLNAGINDLPLGQPFRTLVCDNFSNFVNGQCVPIS